jgi:hypothetical protein
MPADTQKEGFLVEFRPMSPEEMQRMLQFLLNQQAQFGADLAKSQERFDAGMDRVMGGLTGLTAIVGQLALSQQRTDEQLREVIQMFDRHLREDHGHSPA